MRNSLARSTGLIYLLLYTFLSSTVPIAGKIGLRHEGAPFEIVAVRMVLAAIALWLYFLCFRRDRLKLDQAGFIGCLLAATANCASTSSYFFGLAYIDASLAIIVFVTAFIPAVMLLLMIRGEFPSRLDLLRFAIALMGIYLFVGLTGNISWIGVMFMISTAFFYALYVTIIQLRLREYDSQTVTLYTMTFMALLLSMAYLAAGYRSPQFNASTWWAVLWLAIVATAMARLFLFAGIKIAGSRQAALFSPLETLLSVLFAVWLLGESLALPQWLGALLVVASTALAARTKLKTQKENK